MMTSSKVSEGITIFDIIWGIFVNGASPFSVNNHGKSPCSDIDDGNSPFSATLRMPSDTIP